MKKRTTIFIIVMTLLISSLSINAIEFPEGVPSTLPAPALSNLELLEYEDGLPYFRCELTVPQYLLELDMERPTGGWVGVDIWRKVDDEEGGNFDGGFLETFTSTIVPGKANTYYIEFQLEDEGGMTESIINSRGYTYKAQVYYQYYYGEGPGEWDYIYSPWSNELTNKSGSYYKDASSWAVTELDKAKEAGLIPEILVGTDMTEPITREEFAELALMLFEKTSGISAEPVSVNPFTDTQNTQILKALNIGVTQGTSTTTFSPKVLINREQCATMLFRTIKAIAPGDYSIEGIKDFPDQSFISEYAVQPTKYMSKLGIIKGDASTGNFMPKATTTAQQASNYGMATREAAILMSFRTYDVMKY